jgi:HlyD family secretion protein
MTLRLWSLTLVILSLLVPSAAAQPTTYTVEQGPFKLEVTLKGVFEAQQMVPFALHLEAWTRQHGGALLVHKAVEHGSSVRQGEQLLWLDLDRFERSRRDLETERHNEELALQLAEKELVHLEQSAPLELASAEHSRQVAAEDLQQYLNRGRAFAHRRADFHLKTARDFLDYAQEELRQLEKMYKANDITEETEEIILKRQRQHVEFAAFFLKTAERDHEETLKTELPRRERHLRDHAERQHLSLEKLRAAQPLQLLQKRQALAKLRYEHDKTTEKLARLQRDREVLACRAPVDGVVYYGRCVHGHWTTASSIADKLHRGGEVQPEEILITIVPGGPVFVRAEIEEKDLHHIKSGLTTKIVPTADADTRLAGKIDSVSPVPVSAGKFLAQVRFDVPKTSPWVPGMACSVKAVPYQKADALTVPVAGVFTDELDEDRHYVYLAGPPRATRRDVTLGPKVGTRVEIISGLRAGEQILQQKPADAAAKKESKS